MRRYLASLLLLVACRAGEPPFPGPCTIEGESELEVEGKGRIDLAEVTVLQYDARGREVVRRSGGARTVTTYDEDDRKIREETYGDGPVLRGVTSWSYEGGREKRREWDRDADGNIDATTEHEYAADGRRIATHKRWDGEYRADTTYEHDDRGREVSALSRDEETEERTSWEYEGDVLRREVVENGVHGRLSMRQEKRYDEKGRLVFEEVQQMIEGGIHNRTVYERDRRGNVTERVEDNPSDLAAGKWEYEYDYACWAWSDGGWKVRDGEHAMPL